MILNKTKEQCCGCSACFSACPVNAIAMQSDEQGFSYPVIDNEKCVQCGLCEKVCSFKKEHAKAQKTIKPLYYALIHKDTESRKRSRSGGAFFALASAVLSQGGIAYGVALDEKFTARTVRIDSQKDLYRLQGSKYVQSDKNNSFNLVKADLENGKTVLFSGTGCEIAGLHSFLQVAKVNTDRLFTCDLICHGVQSPLLWKDNLEYMQKKLKESITSVSFRDKTFGWHPHIESYKTQSKVRYANRYTTLFYSRVSIRPSCGICHFCSYERSGDITLADFWGAEQLGLPDDLSNGVSLVMVQTENGKELLNRITEHVALFPVSKEQIRQKNLLAPSPLSQKHSDFWKIYFQKGYKKSTDKYYPPINRIQLMYNYLCRRNKNDT